MQKDGSPDGRRDLRGRIETFLGVRLAGWAWDAAAPEGAVLLDVLIDGRPWRQIVADRPRPDLADVASVRSGFAVDLPETMADGRDHTVIVRVAGTELAFAGCPLTFRAAAPGQVIGAGLQGMDGATVRGWAFNHARPGEPVALSLAIDGVPAGTAVADRFRADLAAAGLGRGRCAFEIPLPMSVCDGLEHQLSVTAIATGQLLPGSPMRVRIDPGKAYRSCLDWAPGRDLSGWVCNEMEPDRAVTVEILVDGRLYRTVVANRYRADLDAAGIGNGRHGFVAPLPASRTGETEVVEVRARVASADVELAGGPKRIDIATSYASWVLRHDTLDGFDRTAIHRRIAGMPRRPLLSVLMPVYNPREDLLRAAIGSVRAQLYRDWELCIADDASTEPQVSRVLEEATRNDPRIKVVRRPVNGHISAASNSALELVSGEFIVLLDNDDLLAEHALYMIAEELLRHPEATIIYSDEDKIDEGGQRYDPYFKSGWNPDLMQAQNCISHLGAYRTALVRELGGFTLGLEGSQDYDLALRVSERSMPGAIRHIPHVLYHWRATEGSTAVSIDAKGYAVKAMKAGLAASLRRQGRGGRVVASPVSPFLHVKHPLSRPHPLVSVIIRAHDRPELLRACLDGLTEVTAYAEREVLVVDSGSTRPDALDLLCALDGRDGVRVIRNDIPLNRSSLNNRAVAACNGDVLLFLDDSVKALHRGWLHEMVRQCLRPEVGAVGARLQYPSGEVQHAGVVLGVRGMAAHAHHGLLRQDPGYGGRAWLVQNVSAVTAACMAVRRSVFEEAGGFDAAELPDSFADVDFCLRLGARGYRIVYTPFARLLQHRKASHGPGDGELERYRLSATEREAMRRRWGGLLDADPFYNPNLSMEREDFALAFPSRARRPWRD